MSGRILAERLLATTSVVALTLVAAPPVGRAAACVAVNGGAYVNNATVSCIAVTGNSVSVTNAASGTVGPTTSALVVNPGVTVSGAISNAGQIVGVATSLTAIGIAVPGLIQGGITNSGTITASAAIGATSAVALGVAVFGTTGLRSVASSFGGSIVNNGMIAAVANSTGSATAFGIGLRVSVFSGSIVNSGTISASASGPFAFATGMTASVASFSGDITNSSIIIASAVDPGGEAIARGIGVQGTTANIGLSSNVFASSAAVSFGGSIVNSSTIMTTATGFGAGVVGVHVDASTFSGSISNGGSITATAQGTLFAAASGIDLAALTVGGGVTNTGTIGATATSSGGAFAKAIGIAVNGTSSSSSAASSFAGSVVNLGTVTALAVSGTTAAVTGVSIRVSTFSGSVVNRGSISATGSGGFVIADGLALFDGSYLGGISNSGSIVASATATTGPGVATATGILLCGCVGPFSSGIANSGTIRATAQGKNTANALGASLNSTTFSGGFTNSGTISATANATHLAAAVGVGIGFETSVAFFSGGLTNSGTVTASAVAVGSGSATATGILVFASSIAGNITNSAGTIAALAQVRNGTAIAFGLHVETDTIFAGNIINSGTISAAGNISGALPGSVEVAGIHVAGQGMSGTISNSGTVTATANQGTALGILASSFTGAIANSGTIAGIVSGSGTGVGIGLVTSTATIANTGVVEGSTWAINLANAAGANTVNQNAGSIIGPTSGSGGAIQFSANGDTLNINGGAIIGNMAGTGGVGPTVNVQPGAGNTFSYAGVMSGIGTTNLKSGTLLLQNMAATGVNGTNYTQSANSTLALAVSPAASLNHASISASGTISLAAGSVLQAFEGAFAWTPGTYSYAGVVTGGAITGNFTAVTSTSPFFTANLTQTSTVDNLVLTMLSPSQVPGLDSNQQSVANAIIGIPGGNATLDQIFLLSNPGPTLTQLSGAQYTQLNYQPLIEAWQLFTGSLSNRLSQGQGYGGTVSASYNPGRGIQFAQADISQVAQISDGGRGGATSITRQWGLWARGYGLSSTAPSTATSSPYSESGAGLIVGADNQITDRVVAGVALNVATDKATIAGGGFTQTNGYQGSVYAQYAVDPNWYMNGIAGFGWQTYKTARIATQLTTSTNNGSFEGQSYQVYGETGYSLHPGFAPGLRTTPYLGLGYLHVHTDGFAESGGVTALNVQSMDPNSFATTLGVRAAATFPLGSTVFRPELRAAWQHEFLDATATMRATFVTAPGGPAFTATGTAFSRESFLGGAGVTTTITSSTQLFFDYDARVTGGYTAQVVSGGLRVQF